MPVFTRKARKPRARMKTGGLWNDEERQRLWDLRSLYSHMPWRQFNKQFFPHRSYNALMKAHSVMSLERRRATNISNRDTPPDPPAAGILTLRTRANKRSLPDGSAPGNRPMKQNRTAAEVDETDQNGNTDEDSSSDYEQDSDEETLQGPSLPREERLDDIETIVIDEANNAPEAEVDRPSAQETTVEPDAHPNTDMSTNKVPTTGLISGRKSTTPSSRSEEKYQSHDRISRKATEPTSPSLPPEIQFLKSITWKYETVFFKTLDQEKVINSLQSQLEDLKKLNSDKTAKLESAQEEVKKHLQTIQSLEQQEHKYKKEIDDYKLKSHISDQRITVLERRVVVARSQNKCETCERVNKLTAANSASEKANESSGGLIS
ncbi:hypothetical protein ASPBRDRAFT_39846 [Aspergillus brasiliensis CBS 101740]|uniref:Uncharacterized protein n=1 Tax=Aspergillus brasiliensis (strain CBS 101740 / IMI 381727 / IBT 21946) TaxID=767769 RepID=A0A1L9USZ8_ASPBC|nr:hypothetical protein ASPBRDRAFT_39846 [Aspergillus brasiliensis CBS 101740]